MDQLDSLTNEISPYLLARAGDPVHWRAWSEEALAGARREGRPIFLAVGYASCAQCRLMARESFGDAAVARLLNEEFVPILVDRLERPDVDLVYINAVQILTGAGGWPLSVFLTPEGRPFYGATYIGPGVRQGMPGFRQILEEIAAFHRECRDEAAHAAEKIMAPLRDFCDIAPRGRPDADLSRELLGLAYRHIAASFDGENGGFGGAPKFPRPTVLEFLLRFHAATGEPHAMNMVAHTLDRMARGGLYDQLGGGFHRYATDARWLAPQFEKMLDDNALLAAVYAEAFRQTRSPLYERLARETLECVLRDLASPDGAFYAGQSGETRGVEGAYYLWTVAEIRAVVGAADADILLRHFGVGPIGNIEGAKSTLAIAATAEEIATETGRDLANIERAIAAGRRALFEIRRERLAPEVDDQVIMAWNALAISALARAGKVLNEPRFLDAANRCADFLLARMRRDDGQLWRNFRAGRARAEACLPDYALFAEALLDLYDATSDPRRLETASALAEVMVELFWDEKEGGFFYSDANRTLLPVALKDSFDGPDPSGNSAAVFALLRLSRRLGREDWERIAVETLRLFVPTIIRSPIGMGHMLSALDDLTIAASS
jgi:hypothetical protein